MFKLITTLLKGKAHEAEEALRDTNAMPLLNQQIREAAHAIRTAQRAMAVATAQNEQEKEQHATILSRIADLEERTLAALAGHNEVLAREAAEAIAFLEAERDASAKAQDQFSGAIARLKATVQGAEARLQALQRGERVARATHEAQRLDHAAGRPGLSTLDDAEQTLARLRGRQQQNEMVASVLKQMDGPSRSAGIIEKLANAGCGAPLQSTADSVLARLHGRLDPVH